MAAAGSRVQRMDESVFICALGAATPIGRDPWSSAAAVRGGISGFGEHPYLVDRAGEPMCVAAALMGWPLRVTSGPGSA